MRDFSKATPRPWQTYDDGIAVGAAPYNDPIADVDGGTEEENSANAALIVEAVNSYDANKALIAELVQALNYYACDENCAEWSCEPNSVSCGKRARAALAKAKAVQQ